jgi:hypothetical protein
MSVVGSAEFREKCVSDMIEYGIPNNCDFFEKYLKGKDFNYDNLISMGYDHFNARNIAAYINNKHTGYYENALGWE